MYEFSTGNYTWAIVRDDALEHARLSPRAEDEYHCDFASKTIYIAPGLAGGRMGWVLLHALTRVFIESNYDFNYSVNEDFISDNVKDDVCEFMADNCRRLYWLVSDATVHFLKG